MYPVFCIRLEGFVTDVADVLDIVHQLRLKSPQFLEMNQSSSLEGGRGRPYCGSNLWGYLC